jgi:DNA-binding transcriptional regulator YdaS (Cro superfamily)
MLNYAEMLDALRTLAGSDAKAAPLVGIRQSSFSQWRRRHAFPSDEQARRIADLLGLDAAYVVAIIHGERAKNDETRAVWQRVAAAFGKAAAVAFFTITLTPPPAPAYAGEFDISVFARPIGGRNTDCMRILARVLAWLRGLL